MLRIAAVLRDRFNLELQAQRQSFALLRQDLRKKSFMTLWGHRLVVSPDGWNLIEEGASLPRGDMLLILLDPHLRVLRDGFALPDEAAARGQLDLFSLPNLHRTERAPPALKVANSDQRWSA